MVVLLTAQPPSQRVRKKKLKVCLLGNDVMYKKVWVVAYLVKGHSWEILAVFEENLKHDFPEPNDAVPCGNTRVG